ncbi:hypothetical protein H8B09_04900 [Paenibacillus sp. PR3]|uniref:Copper amine oxidase-like N-terminal domain-containing protein n=1 Tax=Paenibacillus terricola TaxID=2763503 RepID=A0ABR8MQ04_9BACL|nr:hypothetical protein [Paenibacillus terricola]MBD3918080.1 hypothetical protein [Paenibacillus terricola]
MRKFWVGLLCGVVLSFSIAAAAPDTIQGILYPSKITIHDGNKVKEISTSTGATVISFNNQAYIPLRLFAEATGSVVTFKAASGQSDKLNQIEVFGSSTLDGMNITSSDGSVSLGNIVSKGDNKALIEGTVKINKDIRGKEIVIQAISKDRPTQTSEYVYINDEEINPPRPGDIRSFKALLAHDGDVTYRVLVQPIVHVTTNTQLDLNNPAVEKPIYSFIVPSGDEFQFAERPVIPFNFSLMNTGTTTVDISAVTMTLNVYKKDSSNAANIKALYTYRIPPMAGKLAPRELFEINIPWFLHNDSGKPGTYIVELDMPKQIQFQEEGKTTKQTWNVKLQYGSRFEVTLH